jgi:hypothetical protein
MCNAVLTVQMPIPLLALTGLRHTLLAILLAFAVLRPEALSALTPTGRPVARELEARTLMGSKIGTDPRRRMAVYLPPDYDRSVERFPVIYFLPNPLADYRRDFDEQEAWAMFDRAIDTGIIGKVIIVVVDMTTPVGCSWYVNSPVTGNWEDFVTTELVPYIDSTFKTLADRNSRGIAGDRMGGYGAIRLGMRRPDIFGSVYALHPVGTGSGIFTMHSRPDWRLLASVSSAEAVKRDTLSAIFLSMYQAFLPAPDSPPLFADLPAHQIPGGQAIPDTRLTERLRSGFFLEELIPQYADNLKSLRGLKFDWGRGDPNPDHVYANQAFTHKLNEFGIEHEAEEYEGAWGDKNWGDTGRIYSEVLPFFRRYLAFAPRASGGPRSAAVSP